MPMIKQDKWVQYFVSFQVLPFMVQPRYLSKILNNDVNKFGEPDKLQEVKKKHDFGKESGGDDDGEFENGGDDNDEEDEESLE